MDVLHNSEPHIGCGAWETTKHFKILVYTNASGVDTTYFTALVILSMLNKIQTTLGMNIESGHVRRTIHMQAPALHLSLLSAQGDTLSRS